MLQWCISIISYTPLFPFYLMLFLSDELGAHDYFCMLETSANGAEVKKPTSKLHASQQLYLEI